MASNNRTGWTGWVIFAAILMFLNGVFEAIAGVMAIADPDMLAVVNDTAVLFDLSTWGWVNLVVGVALVLSAISLAEGKIWGRTIGTIATVTSIVSSFTTLNIFPWVSIATIAAGFFTLYAIIVHGDELKD